MKIIVLGAGVIGVTTAYVLGRQGHEVIVVDKEDIFACGASHANGGQLAYSYVDPFPNPGILKKLPGYMLGRDSGIKINPTLCLSYYRWGLQFLRHCTAVRTKSNMEIMLGLARRSAAAMQRLSSEIPDLLADENNHRGKIILAKTSSDMKAFENPAQIKRGFGFEIEILDREDCIKKEPTLASWQGEFCGGAFAKGDRTIDPLMLCESLKKSSEQKYGVHYKFGHTVHALTSKNNEITGVVTDHGSLEGDAVIMCLGGGANSVLKSIGQRCDIYPMRGYSLTLPRGAQTPKISITDPLSKLVFANFGSAVRIAGFLDANLSESKITARGKTLFETAKRLWPEAADYSTDDNLWAGYRPMTPSGVPFVKASSIEGLYYNMGHGSLGLTLAAGSAEIIAELVGKPMQTPRPLELEKNHVTPS